jgi:hypothetical protein
MFTFPSLSLIFLWGALFITVLLMCRRRNSGTREKLYLNIWDIPYSPLKLISKALIYKCDRDFILRILNHVLCIHLLCTWKLCLRKSRRDG